MFFWVKGVWYGEILPRFHWHNIIAILNPSSSMQAEAQEAIIGDVSNLCDIAEAMCSEQEEQITQSLLDLPIWGSPRELMNSLCDP